jgi:hypothetical protein
VHKLKIIIQVGQDGSVGIVTHYRLDDPGSNPGGGVRFSAPVHVGPEVHPASCTMGTSSFPGVKRPGRGVVQLPLSSAEVKERVELYLCSPYGPYGLF